MEALAPSPPRVPEAGKPLLSRSSGKGRPDKYKLKSEECESAFAGHAANDDGDWCGAGVTRLGRCGELLLTVVLILGFVYLLLVANDQADFSVKVSARPTAWAQPRGNASGWMALHNLYAGKVSKHNARGFDVIFYGDGLTEAWRGTVDGETSEHLLGISKVFHSYFEKKWRAEAFGIAGDATQNIMWRLGNGEAPQGLNTEAFVLQAGEVDLVMASLKGPEHVAAAANTTVLRVVRLAAHLSWAAPRAAGLLLGLLPRGDATRHPDAAAFAQPSRFTAAISEVNMLLAQHAEELGLTFLDCSSSFLGSNGAIDEAVMPDSVHVNAAGMEKLAQCLDPVLHTLVVGKH